MLNIRTLQILVEVARQGGFSRAAQTVHAVQPTVSKAVQAVEDRLGVRLRAGQQRRPPDCGGRNRLQARPQYSSGIRGS
ncbi:LysR family transcriptional regulator [uncultured Bilophila sp.]|uniref:LysR family transcriptional regulator n=1 Tax=uncultured Bilophila sp. TaxID=529385 RepID=UPI00261A6752|nr:LysR family transcriptional regulator [uncultured Bilophila sp.]